MDCRCSISKRGYVNIFISMTSVYNEYNDDKRNSTDLTRICASVTALAIYLWAIGVYCFSNLGS